ncbi:MAG: DNA polymerase I, partial [Candidatus Omnitrophota bacterium]
DQDKLKIGEPDYRELFRLFKHLEFKSFLKKLPQPQEESGDIITTIYKDLDLRGLIKDNDELILSGTSPDLLTLGVGERLFKLQSPGENLKSILSNPGIKKIGHDLKKIKVSLAKYGLTLEGLYFDTMIAAHLVNPAKSEYNLNDLAWDYLGKAIQDKEIEDAKAAALIAKLLPKLEKELKDKSLFNLFREVEMPLAGVLAYMESNGIRLDLEILNSLSRDLEKRLIKLIEEIYDLSGCQFNINSPKQLREILFEKLKLPVVKKTKSGPSTDEEVLRKLAGKHKLPRLLLEYRQLTKLKSTYIDALPDLVDKKTGRLHTCFNQTATETGRLSSSNPNLQNIPIKTDLGKNIRRAIISFERDTCLLSCDYSQIELRILAHLSKDDNLISAFRKDKDIHKATASLIYGIEEKDVTDQMRETAKRVNFGIVYGLTFFGLSRDLGIAPDEAQAFIDAYFLRYPGVKEYIQQEIEKAKKDGFVTTILGRRRYIPEINNKNQGIRQFAERQAVNTPIQGSASDLIKLTMIQIYEEIKKGDLKLKMILQIHDELVFDVSEKELKQSVDLIRAKMENALKLDVPIRVDIKKGKNWLEMEPA